MCTCIALAHLFSYLSGSLDGGITYTLPDITSNIFDDWIDCFGMSDLDLAGCLRTWRSTAGFWVSALG